jgi:effector-binding domain-containing protein
MIYLIESDNYYKIGKAKDINARMANYRTHNPNFKLIDTADVHDTYERIAHDILIDLRHDGEWFKKDQKVIDVFNHIKNGDYVCIQQQLKHKDREKEFDKIKHERNCYKEDNWIKERQIESLQDSCDSQRDIIEKLEEISKDAVAQAKRWKNNYDELSAAYDRLKKMYLELKDLQQLENQP